MSALVEPVKPEPDGMNSVLRRPTTQSKPHGITRTDVNFWLDLVLLLLFLALAWVSVVLRFVFPPGATAAGWSLWLLSYDEWAGVQFGMLAALALGVLLHVMLHWSWVCGVAAKYVARSTGRTGRLDEGTQTLYGVGLLIVIVNVVGLAIAAAALCVRGQS